ncbi:MAG: restriction endonuclease subunit S [Nitrospira sp.]|nr:restriction endonuclease subunit S [Nitrospira sp.]
MKHGWPLKQVGELFDVQLGKMLSPKAKEGEQLPYLANFNVQWGKFNLGNVKSMNFTESEKEKYALTRGDILMCEGGEVGRCAIWNERSTNFYYQKALHRLRPKDKDTINPYFMCIYMEHVTANNGVTKIVGETSIAHLTREKLCALKIPCPSKEQQDKIVKIIRTWDAVIDKTERLIAAKEKQFKWLLKRLISDQQDNPKWQKRKLGDVAWVAKKKPMQNLSDRKLLTVKLHCLGIAINKTSFNPRINPKGRPYFERKKGELLIGRQNFHNGGFGIVPIELDGYIASNAVTSINLNLDRLNTDFLFYSFSRTNYYKKIGHVMDGTGQKELSDRQILHLSFFVPPLSQQKQIAQTLNAAKQEIALFSNHLPNDTACKNAD